MGQEKLKSALKTTDKNETSFIQADTFEGRKSGYVFKLGQSGLGYYLDRNSSDRVVQRGRSTLQKRVSFNADIEESVEAVDLDKELDQVSEAQDRDKKKAWFAEMRSEFQSITDRELEKLWKLGKKKRKKAIDRLKARAASEKQQEPDIASKKNDANEPLAAAISSHVDDTKTTVATAADHTYDRGYQKWDKFSPEDQEDDINGTQDEEKESDKSSDKPPADDSDWTSNL